MNREEIIRAWKDEEYRSSLTGEELAALPEHPAGIIDLSDAQLGNAAGAVSIIAVSVLISSEVLTFVISCHACHDSVFSGGSCRIGTAGCCGEESTGGDGTEAL